MPPQDEKTQALLRFLKSIGTLRRKRIVSYRMHDRVLWLIDLPYNLPDNWKDVIRSAFLADSPADIPDLWLEVRKKPMPVRPQVPEIVKDWIRPQSLDLPDQEPELLPEITILVEDEGPNKTVPKTLGSEQVKKFLRFYVWRIIR